MTVTAGTAPAKRRRRSKASEPETGRSGAALRAYERRQQRASARGLGAGNPAERGSLTASAITARIPFVALIIGLLSLGLGLTLLLTTRSAGDSYMLSDAKAYNQSLVQERASLQRDVELADSAPELARKAAEQGMIPALDTARLLVAEDGSVQVIGTPQPAQGAPVAPLDPPSEVAAANSDRSTGSSESGSAGSSSNSLPARAATSAADSVPRASSVPPVTRATPNTSNAAGTAALGEQLVPMSIPSASPSGSRQ